MSAPAPQSIDLFDWPLVREAELRVVEAEARRTEAHRRYRVAPHGEIGARRQALNQATLDALQAEAELQRRLAEVSH